MSTLFPRKQAVAALLVAAALGSAACLDLSPQGLRFLCVACDGGVEGVPASDGGDGLPSADGGADRRDGGVLPDVIDGGPARLDAGWRFVEVPLDFGAAPQGEILSITRAPGKLLVAHKSALAFKVGDTWTVLRSINNPSYTISAAAMLADGSVFVLAVRYLGICRANCTDGANYTWDDPMDVGERIYGVCGSSVDDAYAVGERDTGTGILYRYDGAAWKRVSNDLGMMNSRICTAAEDGAIWVAGGFTAARYAADAGLSHEDLDAGALGTGLHLWKGAWAGDGWVHMGEGLGHLVSRSPGGTWAVQKLGDRTFYAVGGTPDSLFAGSDYATPEQTQVFGFTAGAWKKAPALPLLQAVTAICATGPNEIYFGGVDSGDHPGVVRAYR